MPLDIQTRNLIVEKHFREKKWPRTIARELKCAIRSVDNVIKQFLTEHHLETHYGAHRPRIMDDTMTTRLDKILKKKPTSTSVELSAELEEKTGRRVSPRTCRRARRALGYRPVHASKKPG